MSALFRENVLNCLSVWHHSSARNVITAFWQSTIMYWLHHLITIWEEKKPLVPNSKHHPRRNIEWKTSSIHLFFLFVSVFLCIFLLHHSKLNWMINNFSFLPLSTSLNYWSVQLQTFKWVFMSNFNYHDHHRCCCVVYCTHTTWSEEKRRRLQSWLLYLNQKI